MEESKRLRALPGVLVTIVYLAYQLFRGSLFFLINPIADFWGFMGALTANAAFAIFVAMMSLKDREKAFKLMAVAGVVLSVLNPTLAFPELAGMLGIFTVDGIFTNDFKSEKSLRRFYLCAAYYLFAFVTFVYVCLKKYYNISMLWADRHFVFIIIELVIIGAAAAILYKMRDKIKLYEIKKLREIVLALMNLYFLLMMPAVYLIIRISEHKESIFLAVASIIIIEVKIIKRARNDLKKPDKNDC